MVITFSNTLHKKINMLSYSSYRENIRIYIFRTPYLKTNYV